MSDESIAYWLQRFVLEARKANGEHYSPDSLYQLCCGLQRALRDFDREIIFFEQFTFSHFRSVLDGELKRLNSTGKYVHKKKVCVITVEMEEILWEKGLLGDNSPQVLSDTFYLFIGLCFALRSGEEHRRLCHNPSQFTLVEPPTGKAYLCYNEDMSKTNKAGLKQRKLVPKEVVHHQNESNPSRCLIRLFKLYNSLCPADRPHHAFYLAPLVRPTKTCWFRKAALGHNKLSQVVSRLMKSAGIEGYFTNHSLRATAATRLYDAQIDEATIVDRTGHKSTDGVRTYKRESDKLKELSSNVLNQAKRVKVDTSCDIEKEDKSVSSLGAVSENIEPVIAKEEACKMAIRSGASGMTFGGNNCNFTINFSFEQ